MMAKKKPSRQNAGGGTADSAAKILLCEDIEKLGWLGDVVEVKMGYARNYLIPQGLAKAANEANIKSISEERDRRAQQRKSDRVKLEEAVKAVEGAEAVVAAKANEQGHLFGSVSGHEIAANLREQGFEVPDNAVQLGGGGKSGMRFSHIKEVGTHSVSLKFAEDLSCEVSVVVVAEQSGSADPAPGSGDAAPDAADPAGEGR